MKGSKVSLRVRTFCLVLWLAVTAWPGMVFCVEAPVISGSRQMGCGAQQVLSIMNYQTGNTYSWSIADDNGNKGSLLFFEGEQVVYAAPNDNPGCQNNPTIEVTVNGEAAGTFSIAIDCGPSSEKAGTIRVGKCKGCDCYKNPCRMGCRIKDVYCDGSTGPVHCNGWGLFRCSEGCNAEDGACCAHAGFNDLRQNRNLKDCCPEFALPGYQFKPEVSGYGHDPLCL
ncbi:MAG: hypothetical protein JRI36_02180 [Deltaproteobacteria bacterium]|nr:hypothetical protein [Deltaproteobacteria bacterium]